MQLELNRIYGLPDRWLAEELLRLARRCRDEFPEKLTAANRNASYASSLVWDVVPEIAKRLGSRSLTPLEAWDEKVRACDNSVLRQYAGICLKFSGLRSWLDGGISKPATALLVHDVWLGNPIAIAVDRLQPPDEATAHGDLFVRQMREWSRRNGLKETSSWQPGQLCASLPRRQFFDR